MSKHCFNKPLLFSLVSAFLFLQWSASHIHLAGEHQHDDGQYQHVLTTHQHQLANHHVDVIDVADITLSHADTNKVVELDHVCTHAHGKLNELFAFIPFISWNIVKQQISFKGVVTSYYQDSFQAYHQYSPIHLRAPPIAS